MLLEGCAAVRSYGLFPSNVLPGWLLVFNNLSFEYTWFAKSWHSSVKDFINMVLKPMGLIWQLYMALPLLIVSDGLSYVPCLFFYSIPSLADGPQHFCMIMLFCRHKWSPGIASATETWWRPFRCFAKAEAAVWLASAVPSWEWHWNWDGGSAGLYMMMLLLSLPVLRDMWWVEPILHWNYANLVTKLRQWIFSTILCCCYALEM